MAQRRMFSLNIINSARFLRMPIDAQNLYFHLGLRADDDGIVEAFSVMRLIGSSEDNLRLLHAKSFVHVLNDDLVTYITDWSEHNQIRPDRKINSIYQNLLIQIIPEVKLLEPRERADRKNGQPLDDSGTSQGQPNDGIGKDSIGKESKVKEIIMTQTQQDYIGTLKAILNYPFDIEQDIKYYTTLEERYPTLNLLEMIKDYAVYKLDNPIKENDNPRSQINTQCKKNVEWNKNIKTQAKKPERKVY